MVEKSPGRLVLDVWDTTYVETGAVLRCLEDSTRVGAVAPIPQYHVLCTGDSLLLTRGLGPAVPWRHGQPGEARIGCTLPAAFAAAQAGQRVVLDDGKMTGIIGASPSTSSGSAAWLRRLAVRGCGPRRVSTYLTRIS